MRAGRELDQLIEERVFGSVRGICKDPVGIVTVEHGQLTCGRINYTSPGGRTRHLEDVRQYSSEISMAWRVIKKKETLFRLQYDHISDMWAADFGSGEVQAATAPHAICLAALRITPTSATGSDPARP